MRRAGAVLVCAACSVCIAVQRLCLGHSLCAGEYIDDTEDLINIQLDYSRNKLIRFELLLTTGTFALTFFNMVGAWLTVARSMSSNRKTVEKRCSGSCNGGVEG